MIMRKVKYTSKFKRDYKREKKSGHHRTTLDHDLLFNREIGDHQLSGDWKDHRDCKR